MDTTLLVILWIVIIVVQAIRDGKKKKPPTVPPQQTTGNKDFEIPTLANDPNFPGEDITVFKDENKPAEVREVTFTELYRQRKAEVTENLSARKVESNLTAEKKSSLPLNLTAESAMNAIILSEILGKPKALRK